MVMEDIDKPLERHQYYLVTECQVCHQMVEQTVIGEGHTSCPGPSDPVRDHLGHE